MCLLRASDAETKGGGTTEILLLRTTSEAAWPYSCEPMNETLGSPTEAVVMFAGKGTLSVATTLNSFYGRLTTTA